MPNYDHVASWSEKLARKTAHELDSRCGGFGDGKLYHSRECNDLTVKLERVIEMVVEQERKIIADYVRDNCGRALTDYRAALGGLPGVNFQFAEKILGFVRDFGVEVGQDIEAGKPRVLHEEGISGNGSAEISKP